MKISFTDRFYWGVVILIACFLVGNYVDLVFLLAKISAGVFFGFLLLEIYMLYGGKGKIKATRTCSDRFSNGDENAVELTLSSTYGFPVKLLVIDEVPVQFQYRDFSHKISLRGDTKEITYQLTPTERGAYEFGYVVVWLTTNFGLFTRKYKCAGPQSVKVYPSFIKIHQYELMAISKNLTMAGQKQIRKVGNSKEFDAIKDYVFGDDPRNINWAATAKRGHLMTNHYIDERSQNIYCVIDKSRAMKMPFDGMTLLDYSINASLVIADVSLKKGDRAGLVTYENKVDTAIPASNRNAQIYQVMEALYQQKTSFKEADIGSVFNYASQSIGQRSLLLFFTNFESIHSLRRQLMYLKLLNRKHLIVIVYFRNTEVDDLLNKEAVLTREIYNQAIAKQMLDEKYLIRDELRKSGILSLYTTPKNLSVDVLNKYIEIKTKRML